MCQGMKTLTAALRADDNARALTIARQLVYLAAHSDEGQPIAARHDDLVWLRAHLEKVPPC